MSIASTFTDDAAQSATAIAPHRHPLPGRRSPGRTIRAAGIGAVLILLVGTTAACGSGTTTTTTTSAAASLSSPSSASSVAATSGSTSYPAGKEQICQARNQLRTSVTALTDLTLLASGTTAIKAAVEQVQTDLDAVKAAGKQDYQTQVTAMQSALQQLQAAVDKMGDGSATENIQAVGTAITATGAAAEDLFTQLKTACGS